MPSLALSKGMARYIVLLLGLWTLLSYFFYIEYFPSFDLGTVTSVLIALTFVTIPFTAGLSFSFLSPFLFAGMFIRTRPNHGTGKRFKLELFAWMWFTGTSLVASSLIAVFYSVWGWEYHWSLLAYVSTLTLLILVCYKGQQYRHKKGFVVLYGNCGVNEKKRRWAKRTILNLSIKQIGGAFLVGAVHLFALSMVLLYLSRASELTEKDTAGLFNAVLYSGLLTTVGGAIVMYMLFTKRTQGGAVAIAIVILALPNILGFPIQATGFIPMSIVRMAKIGNVRANTVVLSKDVCPLLASSLRLKCESVDAPIRVCNVHIMSRIGSEAFLKFPGQPRADGSRPVKSILIPSEAIRSLELNLDEKALRLKGIDTELAKLTPDCP